MPARCPIPPRAHARRRSTRPRRSCSPTATTLRRSSTWSARGTSTRGSPIRRSPCWRSASPHSRAASARSRRRAGRRRSILPSSRCSARARTSSRRGRCTAARTTSSTTRCRASASGPRSSMRATSTRGAQRFARRRVSCSARRSAIRGWTCSTCRASRPSRTRTDCRCWSTRRSPRRTSCGRSSTAPTSCSIRRPSSCPATASSSAACSSTPARSAGTKVRAKGKFPTLTEPYEGFHDMVFAEESTTAAFLLRARREGIRDFGACMAPFTAFQILQGVETLPLRMERHVANARTIVAVPGDACVRRVGGLPRSCRRIPTTRSRSDCCRAGAAPSSASSIKGTRAQGRRLIESLDLFSHLANVGDAKSLVIHPASTTHFRMSAEDLATPGITEGTIRLSIGLEDPDDLIEDLSRALYAAAKVRSPACASTSTDARSMPTPGARAVSPSQRTVAFVHGAANDHSVWALQSRYFAHHGCQRDRARSAGPWTFGGSGARRPWKRSRNGYCARSMPRKSQARRWSGIRSVRWRALPRRPRSPARVEQARACSGLPCRCR